MPPASRVRLFFFQAEGGIRDLTVTGVQTCALPIYGPTTEKRDAAHRPVARDRQVRQQDVIARVAGVFDRAHDAHIELSGGEQLVELGRRASHEIGRERDDAPVDAAVHRVAVDVADAPDSHSTPSTAESTGSPRCPRARARRRWEIWNVGPSGPCGLPTSS